MDAVPNLCVGLDLIAGFPGETDQEFDQTYRLVERLPVAYLHVFPFSSRPGTPAASMSGHLPSRLVTERARLLRELSERKRSSFAESFRGKQVQVLVQSQGKDGILSGLSRHYLSVSFNGDSSMLNREIPVLVEAASVGALSGTASL